VTFIVWLCVGWCLACLFFGLFLAQFAQNFYIRASHKKAQDDKNYWEGEAGYYKKCWDSAVESHKREVESHKRELDALRREREARESQDAALKETEQRPQ
jgi:DNA-binding transcriptional regulator GbsR (MarR family)